MLAMTIKNIAILGGGVEGRSLARYFSKKDFNVTLCDQRDIDAFSFGVAGMQTCFGERYLENLETYDFVFRSPGIPFLTPAIQRAIKRGAKITSLTKYFFEHCPARIIGVTGTKGKGTTASLLYGILQEAYSQGLCGKPRLSGNIGTSPLEFLDELTAQDIVILELSSFQLQDLDRSPFLAIVLPITEDHLDHHQSMEEYIEAKRNIIRYQKADDIAVINTDKSTGKNFASSFPDDLPAKNVWKADSRKNPLSLSCPALIGEHNLGNIVTAAAAALSLGIPESIIRSAIARFHGLQHRLEYIGEAHGIKFYNDSASTNPDTAIAALRSFTAPVILIAGGSEKFADYTKLGQEIVRRINVRTAVLMGQTSKRIEEAIDRASAAFDHEIRSGAVKTQSMGLRTAPLEVVKADNYQEAFMAAKLLAKPGDTVLLSPASASFDMFKNYAERGEIFKAFVKNMV